jgi:hypothetical protein
MRRALTAEPQRISGEGPGAVVVLSEVEYERLVEREDCPAEVKPTREDGQSLVEFMRSSPLADAFRDGLLPEDIFDRIREQSRCATRLHARLCSHHRQLGTPHDGSS